MSLLVASTKTGSPTATNVFVPRELRLGATQANEEKAQIRFSPTDLVNFIQSEFITWMDRYALERLGKIEPYPDTEE